MISRNYFDIDAHGQEHAAWPLAFYDDEINSSLSRVFWDSKINGFVFYRVYSDEAWMIHLAVKEKNQGHGTRLVAAFLNELRLLGITNVGLELRSTHFAAYRLYQKVGFKEISRRAKYYSDGEDAIVMKLGLANH